jgi:exodeoxyribonuclease III
MRIASWNVNSIKQRVDNAVAWIREREPDIVCFQETKCVDEAFPREPFEALGYNVAAHGQKTFNGVAILSKLPFDEVTPRLPGEDEDDHARFLEAVVSTRSGALRVASGHAKVGGRARGTPNPGLRDYLLFSGVHVPWNRRLHALR